MKFVKILQNLRTAFYFFRCNYWKPLQFKYGKMGENSDINLPAIIEGAENIFIGNNVRIKPNSVILTVGNGKLIIKDNSGSAVGLTVVASNHRQKPGNLFDGSNSDNEYKDIIIEEDVWIGANVTLLSGAHIGRGAIVGAGSVIRKIVPPYATVVGNPSKVIGFKFTPEEIIEHENKLYSENERLPLSLLEKNYNKYYINRLKEIKEFLKQ